MPFVLPYDDDENRTKRAILHHVLQRQKKMITDNPNMSPNGFDAGPLAMLQQIYFTSRDKLNDDIETIHSMLIFCTLQNLKHITKV